MDESNLDVRINSGNCHEDKSEPRKTKILEIILNKFRDIYLKETRSTITNSIKTL